MENQKTKTIAESRGDKPRPKVTDKNAIKHLPEIWQRRQERMENMEALEQKLGITVEEKH